MNTTGQSIGKMRISPPAAGLRSWTAAGLKGEHEAISGNAMHRRMKYSFF